MKPPKVCVKPFSHTVFSIRSSKSIAGKFWSRTAATSTHGLKTMFSICRSSILYATSLTNSWISSDGFCGRCLKRTMLFKVKKLQNREEYDLYYRFLLYCSKIHNYFPAPNIWRVILPMHYVVQRKTSVDSQKYLKQNSVLMLYTCYPEKHSKAL